MTGSAATEYLGIVMKGLRPTDAFVIQFRGPAETRLDRLPGRVEHVSSGHTATFQSVEELPQILRKMLICALADEAGVT